MPRPRLLASHALATVAAVAGLLIATATPTGATPRPAPMHGLDTGGFHTCAISAGEVSCWGSDTSGQLGDGPKTGGAWAPVRVAVQGTPLDGKEVVQVVTGSVHTCARTSDDVIACWGGNSRGQLGDGTTSGRNAPTAVATAGTPLERARIAELVVGVSHTCAVTDAGRAACWGSNTDGELGNGTTLDATVPKAVATSGTALAGRTIQTMSAGDGTTCASATDGTVACWGENDHGTVGDGTFTSRSVPTRVVTALTPLDHRRVVEVSLARSTACARTSSAVVACWGRNDHGQAGDQAGAANHNRPVAVHTAGTPLAAATVQHLARGAEQHCALLDDASVACWGWNDQAQLGDGTRTDRIVPVALATTGTGLEQKPILEVSVGYQHGCAVRSDGQPFCWGSNQSGQLGDGTGTSSLTAVAVRR